MFDLFDNMNAVHNYLGRIQKLLDTYFDQDVVKMYMDEGVGYVVDTDGDDVPDEGFGLGGSSGGGIVTADGAGGSLGLSDDSRPDDKAKTSPPSSSPSTGPPTCE